MFFSIIVPVHDRAGQIGRCLASILTQDFADFELIVVDDGSRDASVARVREFADPRLRLILHPENRGVGPARNSGIDAARADWLIFLDSDDELTPGALELMHRLAADAPAGLGALCFRCRMDDGQLSPRPLNAAVELDYAGYIAFLEQVRGGRGDMLRCVRRACFEEVRYPENRMLEDKFHLDFARRFRLRIHLKVTRLYHQDADNSLVRLLRHLDPLRDRALILDRADGFRGLLVEHGAAVARIAPGLYGDYLQQAATSAVYANQRGKALRYALAFVVRSPASGRSWMILAASILGATSTARLRDALRHWRGA